MEAGKCRQVQWDILFFRYRTLYIWITNKINHYSNAGGLGLIGAGSMYPDVLREHIRKCKDATDKPFGVNVPLMVPGVEQYMQIIAEEKVPIVFTSAGNPKSWTGELKKRNIIGKFYFICINSCIVL